MKKKVIIICSCIIACLFLSACDIAESFVDGYDSGSRGYSYIGQYSSESACSSACANAGGSNYEYNYSTKNCFCK